MQHKGLLFWTRQILRKGKSLLFSRGARERTSRPSEEQQDKWRITDLPHIEMLPHSYVRQETGTPVRPKRIPVTESTAENSTDDRSEDFVQVPTFPELFRLLDAKGTLWGSQKRYTAAELKLLINRVRTHRPALHLPLQVIPETGGLRQRVATLLATDALLTQRRV